MEGNRTSPVQFVPNAIVYDHSHIIIPIMVLVFAFPFLVIACLCAIQKRNKFTFQRTSDRRSVTCQSISGHHGSMSKSTLVSICTDISAGEHRNLNPEARVNDTFVLYKHHPQTCGTSDTIKTVCVEAKCVQIGNLIRHQKDSLRNSCKSQPADDSLDIR